MIKGLICLLTLGVLASSSGAMGKKPAQESAGLEKKMNRPYFS